MNLNFHTSKRYIIRNKLVTVNFKKNPLNNPNIVPIEALIAILIFLLSFNNSPMKAPKTGPITNPKGPNESTPIINPILAPKIPFLDPPNTFVPNIGNK